MDAAKIFTALLEPAGKADPYPLYAGLHELGEAAAEPMPGVIIVHGYEAINSVLRDLAFLVTDEAYRDLENPGWRVHPSIGMNEILTLNPPKHTRIRRQLTRAFTHRRVAGLEPAIARPTAARGRLRDDDQPARQRIAGDPRRPGCRQAVRDRTVPPPAAA